MQEDAGSTCFQITTKTMSEMMTMTRSTNTAAATVSSGWGPVGGGESQWRAHSSHVSTFSWNNKINSGWESYRSLRSAGML